MNTKYVITARLVDSEADFEIAKQIRHQVFVLEQGVPLEEEFDEYDLKARHILAFQNHIPVGTARWRKTKTGIKLERFAVIESARGKGIGTALVQKILDEIHANSSESEMYIYLHAQISAMNLYAKFGFQKVGEMFEECEIPHFKMERFASR